MQKKALITGGSGFIGTQLCNYLLKKGYKITVFDLLSPENKDVTFIKGNILVSKDLKRLEQKIGKIDYVFHLAASLPNKTVSKNTLWKTNIEGTRNIIELALRKKAKSFMFTSSNTVYGLPPKNPVTEKTITRPLEIYGKSKLEAERVLEEYRGKIPIQIFRCPVVSGVGRLGLQGILFQFIHAGKNIYTLGKGDNKYQFINVQDLCVALLKASKRKDFEIYNIGADQILTIKQIYNEVIEHAKSKSKVISLPTGFTILLLSILDRFNLSPLGVYQYTMLGRSLYSDTHKVKTKLKWKPKKTNAELFIENYDWFVKNRLHFKEVGKSNVSDNKSLPKLGILKLLKFIS